MALEYPKYEVIVVDDGSTDDTPAILARYPHVRAIKQGNFGLSSARNAGLRAATGAVVAYTDSDCFVEPDWLTHLVDRLVRSDAGAVGGPNLTPEDGWLAACVAAAPGQPTHVLESDQVAEHVPGCNMAFRREAIEAINGFDPRYRRAGDDVDVCWRLQQAGHWIAFAPGACVWHHRRQTPRAYLRQQAGYGEAEALLQFKHPDRFNGRGDGKWHGVMYGASARGLRLTREIIYRGTFGTGLFQCLYQPGPAHWAMLPLTLEWHLAAIMLGLTAFYWPPAWVGLILMLGAAAAVAGLQAAQADLPVRHAGLSSRVIVGALCYAQPLLRSWQRYWTRLFSYGCPASDGGPRMADYRLEDRAPSIRKAQCAIRKPEAAYWGETERSELLGVFIARLIERHWGIVVDSGWSDWDVEVHYHPWTLLRLCTAQEDLEGGKHVVRVRCRMRPTELAGVVGAMGIAAVAVVTGLNTWLGATAAAMLVAAAAVAWWRGAGFAARAVQMLDGLAREMGLVRLRPGVEGDRPANSDDPARERG
jgi:GT2 family glycosyltransferase